MESTQTGPLSPKPVHRRKKHKGGKALSLTLILSGVGVVIVLVAAQLFVVVANRGKVEASPDNGVVTVINNDESKSLQPVSPKVEASPVSLGQPQSAPETLAYAEVWKRLDGLASAYGPRDENGTVTQDAKSQFIADFLNGLNYKALKWNGPIVSLLNGDPISPEAMLCYLNGYVPDKPYLKANCPTY